jgi:hypothetical protein
MYFINSVWVSGGYVKYLLLFPSTLAALKLLLWNVGVLFSERRFLKKSGLISLTFFPEIGISY